MPTSFGLGKLCLHTILLYWKHSIFYLAGKKNCLMLRPLHILLMAQCACCMPNDSCSLLHCKLICKKVVHKVGVCDG